MSGFDKHAQAPAGTEGGVLELRHVAKRFGNVLALNDVSLTILPGQILGLCGENGAGKSTLVKLMTGVYQADSGEVLVGGKPCRMATPRAAQANGIALVSQELSVCPDLAVVDNIWLGGAEVPFFHRRKALRTRARETLDLLDCRVDLDAKVGALSLGQRQLVEIARMLVRKARVLILDEPTATLSDVEIEHIFSALEALRKQGCAVVLVTHRLAEVFRICDSVAVMRNGEMVARCPAADIDRDRLIALMLGRPIEQVYPQRHAVPDDRAGPPRLEARGLFLANSFGPLDLSLKPGAIVSLVGQLGAGANEVVRSLVGLMPEATGSLRFDGRPMGLGSPRAALAKDIMFVSGDRAAEGIFTGLRVQENLTATRVAKYSRLGLLRRRALRGVASMLAGRVGVDVARLRSRAGELSGGNQQKLALGRCVALGGPGVLAMVEPTRGIDIGARADIYLLMRRFCSEGHALLVASTDLEEVMGISDIVITMYRGRLVGRYEIAELTMQRLVEDITHPAQPATTEGLR